MWSVSNDTTSTVLKLSELGLSTLPKLSSKHLTTVVELSNNSFEEFPKELLILQKLTDLDLRDNKIESIPEELKKCNKLSKLLLSNNKIKNIPNIFDLNSLKTLAVDGNPLEKIEGITDFLKLTIRISPNVLINFE